MHTLKRLFWFTRFFIRCGGWVALFPLVVGVLATVESLALLREHKALTDHGIPAQATVLDLRYVANTSNRSKLNTETPDDYYLTYEFTPLGAVSPLRTEEKIRRSFYATLEIGQSFPLLYLPENPNIQSLDDGDLEKQSQSSQVVGFGVSVIGFLAVLWFYFPAIRAERARRSVTEITDTTEIIDTHVTLRPLWPPLLNRMTYQVPIEKPAAKKMTIHKTFMRPFWAYNGLKRASVIRVALTPQGPYWTDDLFIYEKL